jgi:hypothetical protein
MAGFEETPPGFRVQRAAQSAKFRFYENLLLWNQGIDQVVGILRRLERLPFSDKRALRYTQAEIEEIRSGINADFVEEIGEHERRDQGRFWKQRRAYERTLEDPDDIYRQVEEREKQRQKRGLPLMTDKGGRSTTAGEGGRNLGKQRRKK